MAENKKASEFENRGFADNINNSIITHETPPIDYLSCVPDVLQSFTIFVGYDKDKLPINPRTGNKAQSNNRQTWADLKTAIESISKFPTIKGIGIQLGETDIGRLCGIDIDNCVDSEGNITPEAQKIINSIDSYTELSPSETGIHITFIADKKGKRCKNINLPFCKTIEMYDSNRYFTFTGKRLNDKGIEHRQAECDYIYDTYIEPKEKKEPQNVLAMPVSNEYKSDYDYLQIGLEKDKKLKSFYNGSRESADESSNDCALMSKLMHWCNNNKELAISTFYNSPYAGRKDDAHKKKLQREDYLRRTAENCICETTARQANSNYLANSKNSISNFTNNFSHLDVILQKLNGLKRKPHKYSWDDKGNGELFAEVFKDSLRFDLTSGEWRNYNGKIWKIDMRSCVAHKYAKLLKDALFKYSTNEDLYSEIEDETERANTIDNFRKYIIKLGKKNNRDNQIKDAQSEYPIKREDLDSNDNLFNCQNGTLNLETFEFKAHQASDLLSKIANVEYDPNASAEVWIKFINDVLQGDLEKILYLQKALGYALTTDTSYETCFILYGATTRNGKSTLIMTIMEMLGDYAMQAKPETLEQKKNNDSRNANGDVARLDGARFLNVSEPPKRMIFDIALLKTLLGRDKITARQIYEKEFEFYPIFKLFINTNYLPQIADDTIFSSGRINVITFDRHFEPKEQDKHLKDRLIQKDNLSGVFNWCLEGLKLFREEGLKPPLSIANATEEYRKNSDKIGNFISDCLIESSENIKASDAYEAYQKWCKGAGYGVEGQRNFYSELKGKNLLQPSGTVKKNTVRNVICGYSIIDDYKPQEPYPYRIFVDD